MHAVLLHFTCRSLKRTLQVLALPEHLDATGVGDGIVFATMCLHICIVCDNSARYTGQLVEHVIALIVTAVSKIECINPLGLRQLHVDLDYVVNCCRWV
jgi:hypothetical protein